MGMLWSRLLCRSIQTPQAMVSVRLVRPPMNVSLPSKRWPGLAGAVTTAVLVVLSVFPDVVFFGASFRSSRVQQLFDRVSAEEAHALIPETQDRMIGDGYRDLPAASLQVETVQRFLRRCLIEGESPYWNPYTASGTHGPEALTSPTFSVITVATALLGAGSRSLHAVLLIVYAAAVFSLYRILTAFLGRSVPGSIAACFGFLLVGFHTSLLGTQVTQPYVLSPIVLLALLSYLRSPNAGRLVLAVVANAMLLAETFLPTTVLILTVVHGLGFAYGVSRWRKPLRDGFRQLASQVLIGVLALALAAPLWLPLLESSLLTDWNDYQERRIKPVSAHNALSFATPKHFWESYNGHRRNTRFEPDIPLEIREDWIAHVGVVALFLALQTLAVGSSWRNPIVVCAVVLIVVAVARIFHLFPFDRLDNVPIIGLIRLQYWAALYSLPFCLLLAYGIDSLRSRTVWRAPTLMLLGFFGACYFFLADRVGVPDSGPALLYLRVFATLVALVTSAFAWLYFRPASRAAITWILVAVMVGEWIFYMNRLRPERRETDFDTIEHTAFLRRHLSGERVMNMGYKGLPANWGSALGIPQVGGMDGASLGWYSKFFAQRFGKAIHFPAILNWRDRSEALEPMTFDVDALDLLGVRYLVTGRRYQQYRKFLVDLGLMTVHQDPQVMIFENPGFYPRAWAVDTLIAAPGIPSDWHLPGRQVAVSIDRELLDRARILDVPSRARPARLKKARPVGKVEISRYRHTRVELTVSFDRPGIAILADTWHPGWRATVDGEPTHLGRVNEILRGVAVAAGQHQIIMIYQPRSLRPAVILAALTAILCGSWIWWRWRQQSVEVT